LSLTRAFQYAGARSVVASLWGVGDDGTAELMRRFYGYLKAGESKDESLRHAQVDLLTGAAGEAWKLPFHWAAFELFGDWRQGAGPGSVVEPGAPGLAPRRSQPRLGAAQDAIP
jgi:CHAT domain-containing protein